MPTVDLFGILREEWRRIQIWVGDALYALEQKTSEWGWLEYGLTAFAFGLAAWVIVRRQR